MTLHECKIPVYLYHHASCNLYDVKLTQITFKKLRDIWLPSASRAVLSSKLLKYPLPSESITLNMR